MNTMMEMLKRPMSQKQIILLTIAVAAAAAVFAVFTGDAAFANDVGGCRHGGAPWDWTCR